LKLFLRGFFFAPPVQTLLHIAEFADFEDFASFAGWGTTFHISAYICRNEIFCLHNEHLPFGAVMPSMH